MTTITTMNGSYIGQPGGSLGTAIDGQGGQSGVPGQGGKGGKGGKGIPSGHDGQPGSPDGTGGKGGAAAIAGVGQGGKGGQGGPGGIFRGQDGQPGSPDGTGGKGGKGGGAVIAGVVKAPFKVLSSIVHFGGYLGYCVGVITGTSASYLLGGIAGAARYGYGTVTGSTEGKSLKDYVIETVYSVRNKLSSPMQVFTYHLGASLTIAIPLFLILPIPFALLAFGAIGLISLFVEPYRPSIPGHLFLP